MYTAFVFEDGTSPQNWAQLRRAILEGKKLKNLRTAISNHETQPDSEHEKENNGDKSKDKEKNK